MIDVLEDVPEASPPPAAIPPPPPPPFPARTTAACVFALIAGLCVLVLMVAVVQRAQRAVAWNEAAIIVSEAPPWEGTRPAWVRYLTTDDLPQIAPISPELENALQATEDGRLILKFVHPEKHERLVAVDVPVEELAPLLESGRLPEPGKNEVLAGDLARWDSFTIDDRQFTVVGRIKRGASATVFGYVLPYNDAHAGLFTNSPDAKAAWLDLAGLSRFEDLSLEDDADILPEDAEMIGGIMRTPNWVALATVLGILLVAAGGAGLHIVIFQRLAHANVPLLNPIFRESATWPRLFVAHHVLFFGLFLAVMLAGTLMPLMNLRLMYVIQNIFVEGELKYVGDAYASGNVWHAAYATFFNNYVHQTVYFTLAASLFIPFFGLLKNAASFALAGFGMAPIWTSALPVLPFHAITIALELEAYVVACFAVTLWPVYFVLALRGRNPALVVRGLVLMISTAVITCILLAVAALYEATTLILLRA